VRAATGVVYYPEQSHIQRSLIAIRDIDKGERLVDGENFKSLRPGGGIEPKYLDKVNGQEAEVDIRKGTLLSWDLIGGPV